MTKSKRKPTKRRLVYLDIKTIIGKAETISAFMENIPKSFRECDNYWTTHTILKRIPNDKDDMVMIAFMERDKYFSLGNDEVREYFSEYVNTFWKLLQHFRDLWMYEYKIPIMFPEYKMHPILSYPVLYKRWSELFPELAEADALFRAALIMAKAGIHNSTMDARLDELLGEGNMNLLKLPCYSYLMEKAEFVRIMNGGK